MTYRWTAWPQGFGIILTVREALTNVLKHADPRCEVHLFAESTGEQLEVVVRTEARASNRTRSCREPPIGC